MKMGLRVGLTFYTFTKVCNNCFCTPFRKVSSLCSDNWVFTPQTENHGHCVQANLGVTFKL